MSTSFYNCLTQVTSYQSLRSCINRDAYTQCIADKKLACQLNPSGNTCQMYCTPDDTDLRRERVVTTFQKRKA
jgi:hypothetical protein